MSTWEPSRTHWSTGADPLAAALRLAELTPALAAALNRLVADPVTAALFDLRDAQARRLPPFAPAGRRRDLLALAALGGDELVGAFKIDGAQLSYLVAPARRGRGHGHAIVAAACHCAWRQLALPALEAAVLSHNLPSIWLLEAAGFGRAGIMHLQAGGGVRQQALVYRRRLADQPSALTRS